ncbi:probable E3 ubiquitin-protein ligase TRIML1 [Gracilinanus agilis]|uniref:probable E3 ubiquitin-protein ligase TRIML1 n=1 Tax=Gracilinanus agilis TaxID=191870 RepID=UPI001CFF3358|nr:probable E3 ubiquitin-protein ligase TRIML1 [Gracilinanus agilis]
MASCSELIQDVQEELICSICKEYFTNPVSIECGHNFCHSCLSSSWQEASTSFSCPECRVVSQVKDFIANVRLGKLAAIAKKLRLHCFQNPEGYSNQKEQKLFCENDQNLSCLSFPESQKHKGHALHCIDEAAQDVSEMLQETLTDFRRKLKNVEQQKANEKLRSAVLEEEVKIQKGNISSEFQKLHIFLREEEAECLSVVQRQGEANLKGLKKKIKRLSLQSQELSKRITEIDEECRKPDVDFLQDIKEVLNRNEFLLQEEIDTFAIKMIVCPIPGIIEMLLKFKMDITLDDKTATPGLIISEDLKSARYGGAQLEVLNNSERFSNFAQVFAVQSFTSGRFYWEVEVPSNTEWGVGISKGQNLPEEFFVLMAVQSQNGCQNLYTIGKYYVSSEADVKYCQNCVTELVVGVFLDCEHGEISFYNVKERSLIFTFPTISFSGPFRPVFCLSTKDLTNDSSLVICP